MFSPPATGKATATVNNLTVTLCRGQDLARTKADSGLLFSGRCHHAVELLHTMESVLILPVSFLGSPFLYWKSSSEEPQKCQISAQHHLAIRA